MEDPFQSDLIPSGPIFLSTRGTRFKGRPCRAKHSVQNSVWTEFRFFHSRLMENYIHPRRYFALIWWPLKKKKTVSPKNSGIYSDSVSITFRPLDLSSFFWGAPYICYSVVHSFLPYSAIVPEHQKTEKLKLKTEKLKNQTHMENLFLDVAGKSSF